MDNGQKGHSPEPVFPMRLHVPSAKAEGGVIREEKAGEEARGKTATSRPLYLAP